MNPLQITFLIFYAAFSLWAFGKGLFESFVKKNSFGDTPFLFELGIFVWGDATIFGLFWFLAAMMTLILRNWTLFLLIVSIFWLVRSAGESIYWFNQQFSTLNRNPPANLRGFHLFQNESIWFIYQIFWQCITVISIISTLWLVRIFLSQ